MLPTMAKFFISKLTQPNQTIIFHLELLLAPESMQQM